MAVQKNPNAQHPLYKALIERWCKVRDFASGSHCVKAAGTKYLPMLGGQTQDEYENYKLRALFFAVTWRTVGAFVGMVFRKPSTIEATQAVKDGFLKRCTAKRKDVETLERATMRELLCQSRVGLLVDLPELADANTEPWIALYTAENILDWRYGPDDKGMSRLEYVVVKEQVEEKDPKEPDETICIDQWREIELMMVEGTWQVIVTLWRKAAGASSPQAYMKVRGPAPVIINGRPLDRFPFVLSDLPDEEESNTPPMEAIADVNHSHYMTSADLEHGRHFTALPTPYVTGVDKQPVMKIGSQTAWTISEPLAKVGMLEFTGQGLQALEKGLEQKANMAAALGARMLEDPKKAVEATQTHEIRRSGEQSVLATITRHASKTLNQAFEIVTTSFLPALGKITDELNTDFSAMSLSAQDLTALVAAMQAGAISEEVFFYNLEQAEMYPPGHTFDDESKQRQAAFDRKTENDAARLATMQPTDLNAGGNNAGN